MLQEWGDPPDWDWPMTGKCGCLFSQGWYYGKLNLTSKRQDKKKVRFVAEYTVPRYIEKKIIIEYQSVLINNLIAMWRRGNIAVGTTCAMGT